VAITQGVSMSRTSAATVRLIPPQVNVGSFVRLQPAHRHACEGRHPATYRGLSGGEAGPLPSQGWRL